MNAFLHLIPIKHCRSPPVLTSFQINKFRNPDHENPNPHCHLMLTMRPFNKNGTFLEKKCWREYELDKNGQKIPTKDGKDFKSHKVYATDWDDRGNVEKWRALWAEIESDFYRKNGYEITAEHRSFERQGMLYNSACICRGKMVLWSQKRNGVLIWQIYMTEHSVQF